MKKIWDFKKLGIVFALFLSIFILSCSKEEPIDVLDLNLALKNGDIFPGTLPVVEENILPEVVECELTAGQYINAGYVTFEKVGENIVVTYLAMNGWGLKEVHLYVGSPDGLPVNNKAVKVGHFPYSKENLSGVETWEFVVPLAELDPEEHCIIAAHAVVYNESLDKEETAWSNCDYKPVVAVKVKFPEGKNAESDGISYIDNIKGGVPTGIWCDYLGYNFYDIGGDGDEYLLVNGIHFPGDNAGNVVVSDDGDMITVEINTKYDMLKDNLGGSYLYVGTFEGLVNFELHNECPNYHNFPYKNLSDGGTQHIYDIPIPAVQKSVSFKTLIGASKWGWVSFIW
ncbi:MAG: hypothetical protein R2757_21835 [Draconibacterium sp.]